jgi:hypothetical protein
MHKKSLEITCYVCGAGAFGVFFRWLQVMMAFDEQGLNEKSAFNFLVPLLILASAWLFKRFVRQIRDEKLFVSKEYCDALYNPGKLFTVIRWIAGMVMAIGALVLFVAAETDVNSELLRILALLALLSGITFPIVLGAANYDELAHVAMLRLFTLLPVLMYSLWLIVSYKQNSYNSVPWDYAIEMLSIIVAILGYFRVMGFAYFVVDGKKIMFAVMMCAMLSIMSLADSRYMGMQIIIMGTAIQMALYNWILIMNLKRRKPRSADESAPVIDEGGFRHIR